LTASVGSAAWIDEEGSYPTNSAAFANKKLVAYKLGNIELVSEELLADTFINLRSELGSMYAESFGATEEAAFTDGDGSGKPTGFLQDSTAALTAAAVDGITYGEVIDLQSSVAEKYARNGIYMCNRSTAAALRKLADSNGMPLWAPAMTAGMPDTLFGKDLRVNESMADLAANSKSLSFGDFNYYRIADRAGLMMQMLVERYAETGQVGFKFMKRTDGLLLRADAVKHIVQPAS
jgi:HK97 family phage major capsid protein